MTNDLPKEGDIVEVLFIGSWMKMAFTGIRSDGFDPCLDGYTTYRWADEGKTWRRVVPHRNLLDRARKRKP